MSVDCSMLQCRLVLNLMLPSSESRILCFKLAILLQWQSISFMVVRRKKFYLFLIIILQPYEQIWQGLQCYVSHWGKILILSKNSFFFFLCLGICCFLRHFEKWLFFLSLKKLVAWKAALQMLINLDILFPQLSWEEEPLLLQSLFRLKRTFRRIHSG